MAIFVRKAWVTFAVILDNFFEQKKPKTCKELDGDIFSSFESFRCNMPIKVHFSSSHQIYFSSKNLVDASDEQIKYFH